MNQAKCSKSGRSCSTPVSVSEVKENTMLGCQSAMENYSLLSSLCVLSGQRKRRQEWAETENSTLNKKTGRLQTEAFAWDLWSQWLVMVFIYNRTVLFFFASSASFPCSHLAFHVIFRSNAGIDLWLRLASERLDFAFSLARLEIKPAPSLAAKFESITLDKTKRWQRVETRQRRMHRSGDDGIKFVFSWILASLIDSIWKWVKASVYSILFLALGQFNSQILLRMLGQASSSTSSQSSGSFVMQDIRFMTFANMNTASHPSSTSTTSTMMQAPITSTQNTVNENPFLGLGKLNRKTRTLSCTLSHVKLVKLLFP